MSKEEVKEVEVVKVVIQVKISINRLQFNNKLKINSCIIYKKNKSIKIKINNIKINNNNL